MLHHFDYDQKAPLQIKHLGVERRAQAVVYDLTYASPKGGVVPCLPGCAERSWAFCSDRVGSLVLGKLFDAQSPRVPR
jgi:hypothetical protein